jgi:hypothetical protein
MVFKCPAQKGKKKPLWASSRWQNRNVTEWMSHLQFFLAPPLLLEWHTFFVLLKVFPLCRLKVEPRVRKGLYMGQESLDKRMELVLE